MFCFIFEVHWYDRAIKSTGRTAEELIEIAAHPIAGAQTGSRDAVNGLLLKFMLDTKIKKSERLWASRILTARLIDEVVRAALLAKGPQTGKR